MFYLFGANKQTKNHKEENKHICIIFKIFEWNIILSK